MNRYRTQRRERALERGADELMSLCEWALRDWPRKLKRARRGYALLCLRLDRAISRAQRRRP